MTPLDFGVRLGAGAVAVDAHLEGPPVGVPLAPAAEPLPALSSRQREVVDEAVERRSELRAHFMAVALGVYGPTQYAPHAAASALGLADLAVALAESARADDFADFARFAHDLSRDGVHPDDAELAFARRGWV
jgi:hypothetical protein